MVIDGFAMEEMQQLMILLNGFFFSCSLVPMLCERPYVGDVLRESVAVYRCTVLMSVSLFDSVILIFRKEQVWVLSCASASGCIVYFHSP